MLLRLEDRYDSHLNWCQVRRQHKSVVVGVCHDERTHKTGRYTERGSPRVLIFVFLAQELYIERFCEVLSEEVAGACLECFAVLHHCLDTIGLHCAGETLVRRFDTFYHGDCHNIFRHICIDVEHLLCESICLLACSVCGVSFLPKELGGTKEKTGTHLPTHDVAPLVAKHRQVAVTRNPILVCGPDNCFGSGADNEFLFQSCVGVHDDAFTLRVVHQAVVCNHCALFGEALHMLCLAAEIGLRYQHRKVCVLYAILFETCVKRLLDTLPNLIAIRFDNHTPAHSGLLCEVGFHYQLIIPLRVINCPRCQFLKICHYLSLYCLRSCSNCSGCAFSSSETRLSQPEALSPYFCCKVTAFLSISKGDSPNCC